MEGQSVPDRARAFAAQLSQLWAGLSLVRRVALVLATSAVLVAVLAAASLRNRVEYATLFADLSTEDAAAIAEKLKAQKVPFRIEAGGTVLQVPEERVHALRLELASGGLPRGGGVGFEIFDRSSLGATEFEQRINLRRALEGELARSIGTIEGVQSARVHLVLPENRIFASRREDASASVVLKLRGGREFGRREVAGIVHLVAAAVPGLGRDQVSVVSTEGVTLHQPSPEGAAASGLGERGVEQARELGTGMEHRVRSLLERVVGPGNADVRVDVQLDETTTERTEEHYEPTRTALRSEQRSEESAAGEGASVAGVPGAQSNLPGATPEGNQAEAAAGAGGSVRRSHTRNWEIDRVTQKTHRPAGSVARVTVAAVVNGSWATVEGKPVFTPRPAEELAKLEGIVRGAVGFDSERGDVVRIEAAQFARLDDDPAPAPVGLLGFAREKPGVAAAVVLGLLGLVAGAVVLVRRQRRGAAALGAADGAPHALPGALASEPGALPEGTPAPALLGASPDAGPAAEEIRAEALRVAAADPATAAIILKKWLAEAAEPARAA